MTALGTWLANNGQDAGALGRTSGDGRDLGKAFERFVDRSIRATSARRTRAGLAPLEAQWTQPGFVKAGPDKWIPKKKGWLDLNLFLEGRVVVVDCKAADMAAKRNKNRWALHEKLRRDKRGHQIARLDRLAALGHSVGVLLGRWQDGRWSLYVVPVSVDFHRASIPWPELEPYRVPQGAQWWEVMK